MAAPLRRPQELTRMPKDTSILLVANARPFEIGKLYFFRDRRMRRLMEKAGAARVAPPGLRRWTEASAWLEADVKSGLVSKVAQAVSTAIPASLANEGSGVGVAPRNPNGEAEQEERTTIDIEVSKAIAGVTAEAQRAVRFSSSDTGDEIGSALEDLTVIAEKIRKGWSAT
jgi:hypothetical protein